LERANSSRILTEGSTLRFMISSMRAFLKILPDILSLPRRSCSFKSRSLIPQPPYGCAQCLFPNIRPFWVPCTTLFLPGPWRRAGMATWFIPLRAAANFFQDPPSLWVCWPRRPTARCWSPCRFFSAMTGFTAASYLATSSCSATDFISSGFASIFSG
jgi:hypothetical protein